MGVVGDDKPGGSEMAGVVGTRQMRIDVTSDIICPFCLLGMNQLLTALKQYNKSNPSLPIEANIRLLPFQLNPALAVEPMSRGEYMRQKFGARAEGLREAMAGKMREAGYETNKDGQISSSHVGHRLQTYTLLHHPTKQLDLAMDIFESFHVGGIHSSHIPTLANLAVKHGVFASEEEATKWLEGNECDEEVQKGYAVARRLGITGVPFFVFQGKWAGSGAMGVEGFMELLEEVARREGDAGVVQVPATETKAAEANPEDAKVVKAGADVCE